MNDLSLWRNFSEGDQQAFEVLFTRYYKVLFQYGLKMVRNRQLLDDCVQDLFFELWVGRANITPVQSVRSYLFKALKYKLYREISRDQRMSPFEGKEDEFPEFSYEAALIAEQTQTDRKKRLLYYVQQLTRRQQEALYLRFYGQMSYEEISEVMAITYQAAVNLIHKSVKFLREKMLLFYSLLLLVAGL